MATTWSIWPTVFTTGGAAAIVVSGTSGGVPFESVALRNNTLSVIDTIRGRGLDTVTLTSADNLHGNANLSLKTGRRSR